MLAKKTLILLAGLTAMALLLIYFLIYPLIQGIKKSSAKLFSLREETLSYEAQTEKLVQLKARHKRVQPELRKTESLFISQKAPIKFLEFLEQTASSSNLAIDVSISGLKKDKPWDSMTFQIELNGAFSDCLQFIKKIETAPYLIELQSLRMKKITEKDLQKERVVSLGDINVGLAIKVFANHVF